MWVQYKAPKHPRGFVPPHVPRDQLAQRELFIDNPLFRIHFIIEMIRCTSHAPWKFESPFPGSLITTFLELAPPPPRSTPRTLHPTPLHLAPYRGTSLTRKRLPLGPYSRAMPRALS